jgi:putative transposase
MRTNYQYRLKPTKEQESLMIRWLDMLRYQYNWLLAERLNWYEQNRSSVNKCSILLEHLPELKSNPDYYSQQRSLVELKQLRPWYREIHSQVLQDMVKRLDLSFQRYLKGDSGGKRSGRPRFKSANRYRSFTYPQTKNSDVANGSIRLSKIGWVKFVQHRPIPAGFNIKTVNVSRKADGWYVTLSLEDKSVPELPKQPILPLNTIGIDLGLKSFLVTSAGQSVHIPQFCRKSQKRLAKLNRDLSRTNKGSKRRQKLIQRLSKHHQKVVRQRKQFHYETAKLFTGLNVAHEKLNIKGLAKTRLSKSINDAGWRQFLEILKVKAESAGLSVVPVNPKNTSQACSNCGQIVPKTLSERVHKCDCGCILDRDHNAAINIKKLAEGHSVSKAQEMSDAIAGVTEKPRA